MIVNMNFEEHIIKNLNQYLIDLYHQSQGEDTQTFQDKCCDGLKKTIDFSQIKWEVKSKKPEINLHADAGFSDINENVFYSSLERHCKIDHSGVYHVITLFRKNGIIFNSQDKYLFEFVLPHMAAAFRFNMLSLFNKGLKNSVYRGVCNETGRIIEAEDGFYKKLSDRDINCEAIIFKLNTDSDDIHYFIHQSNLIFYTTKKFGFHYLEFDKSINNLSYLTNKQKEVCYLLKRSLSNEAIAIQLKSSKKTVEHHLVAIYEKLKIQGRGNLVSVLNK